MLLKDAILKLIKDNTNVYLVDSNSRSISLGVIKRIVPSEHRKETPICFYFEYCMTEKKGVQYRIIDSVDDSFGLCSTKDLAVEFLMGRILLDIEAKVKYINKMACEANKHGEEFGILLPVIPMPKMTTCITH
jgi:hypothetical protein